MAEFVDSLRARDGRVLEFTWPGIEYVPIDSMVKVPGLRIVARRADGVVLGPLERSYTSTSAEKRSAISSALSAPPNR